MTYQTEFQITIREWLASLRQAGASKSTLRQYNWHLLRLAGWLAGRGVVDTASLSKSLLREWGASLHDAWSPSTVRQAVSSAKNFLTWCRDEELINEPLAKALRLPPQQDRTVHRTFTEDEILQMVRACDMETAKGLRDVALIGLMVDSGLRASEVCRLKVSDIQTGVRAGKGFTNMVVVRGKGGTELPSYFGAVTASALAAWLEVRQAMPGVDNVFISVGGLTPGRPLTRDGLRSTVYKLCDAADIKRGSPHALRRAFACIAHDAGASSRQIQAWGRWGDISQVERYTRAYEAGRRYTEHSPMDYIKREGQNIDL